MQQLLLEAKNQVLHDFLLREIRIKNEILSSLEKSDSERAEKRKNQIRNELAYVQKGMEYYGL